jgi:acetate kinase
VIRAEIAAGLEHLDVWLDEARNWRNAALISSDSSKCDVRVIAADEEAAIARLVTSALR